MLSVLSKRQVLVHSRWKGVRRLQIQLKEQQQQGIPVIGHLGLTPQSIHKFGGYGLRAKDDAEAEKLIEDALALDAAGVSAITLEKVPAALATKVTSMVKAATIGIGAGNGTDGRSLFMQMRLV